MGINWGDPTGTRPAPLQAAVAGAGLMGAWHAHAIRRAGGRVAAVIDADLQAAQRLARKYAGALAVAGLAEALDRTPLQVLHLCTPTATHAPLSQAALEVGLHVMVEKPAAESAAQTAQLAAGAQAHGRLICPVHQFCFQRGVAQARRRLPRLGRLVHWRFVIQSAGGAGRGAVEADRIAGEILPHPLALLAALYPSGLAGIAWGGAHPQPGELRVLGEGSDGSVSVEISLAGRPPLNTLEIVGANGSLRLDLFHGYAYALAGGASKLHKIVRPFEIGAKEVGAAATNLTRRMVTGETAYPGLRALVQAFYRAVQTGTASPIAPDAMIAVAAARDEILGAVRTHAAVSHAAAPHAAALQAIDQQAIYLAERGAL